MRRVESVAEVTGMEGGTPLLQEIFALDLVHQPGGGRMGATFRAAGIVPRFVDELRRTGIDVPLSLFTAKEA